MAFDIDGWVGQWLSAVRAAFGERVWFAGLQGSYGRGEATASSDIDAVLILDTLSPEDLAAYGALLDTLPERGRVCGFFGGRAELLAWDKAELFQFCHDTAPLFGSLDALLAAVDRDAVRRAVKSGACGVYHACVHNALHERDAGLLAELYKSAAFTLQAVAYLQTGVFEKKQERLAALLTGRDRAVLETRLALRRGALLPDLAPMTRQLLQWSAHWIAHADKA